MNKRMQYLIGSTFLTAGLALSGCGTDHSPVSSQDAAAASNPTQVAGETAYFALSPSFNGAAKIASDEALSDAAYAQIPGQLEGLLSHFPQLHQDVQAHFDAAVAALQGDVVDAQANVVAAQAAVAAAQAAYDAIGTQQRHQEAVLAQMRVDADAELARQDAVLEDIKDQIEAAHDADDETLENQLKADKEAQEDYIHALEDQFKAAKEAQEDLIEAIEDTIKPDLETAKKAIEVAKDGVEDALKVVEALQKQIEEVQKDNAEAAPLAQERVTQGAAYVQGAHDELVQAIPDYAAAAGQCTAALQTLEALVVDGLLTTAQIAPVTQVLYDLERPLNRRGVKRFKVARINENDKSLRVRDKQRDGSSDNLNAYFTVVKHGIEQDETITMTLLGDRLDNLVIAFQPAGLAFKKDATLVVNIGSDLVNIDDLEELVAYHIDSTGNKDAVKIKYVENGNKLEITFKVPGFSRYGMWRR